ncbi:helix-turn-helix protein domain [Gaiella occulta]|uniref:Helix-turn-helix protein domain n=2 Tax=Gaiella occulta TaxID=1002870 RepID=A0A7M2Z0X3_9ACTN|nr:helix-turn-helix protein domain [Gaiella occulta]
MCDNGLTMAEAARESGDEKLARLFAEFEGHVISPGGAAHLLGLSRKTIYTLCKRGELRAFRSDENADKYTPRWVYIPIVDIRDYAVKVGRPIADIEKWLGSSG